MVYFWNKKSKKSKAVQKITRACIRFYKPWQIVHWKGLSPVWVRKCLVSSLFRGNTFSHIVQRWRSLPVWSRIWMANWALLLKLFSQYPHAFFCSSLSSIKANACPELGFPHWIYIKNFICRIGKHFWGQSPFDFVKAIYFEFFAKKKKKKVVFEKF